MILETRDEGFKHSGDIHLNLPDHMPSREFQFWTCLNLIQATG